MSPGSSSRTQNRSIPYPTIAHIPEKVPMRPKSLSCLVSIQLYYIIIIIINIIRLIFRPDAKRLKPKYF